MSEMPALNQSQKEAVTHGDGPLLIVAGAGTGKTTVITERIVWLITQKQVPPDAILAMTFTDKAAEEMVERVDRRLPYGYVDLWVSTFHSFAERVLREHALDIGLDPNFRILNETEAWLLVRRHLDDFTLDYYRPLGNPTKFIQSLLRHFSRCKDEAITPEEYLSYAERLKLDRDEERFLKKKGQEDTSISEAARVQEVAQAFHQYQQLLHQESAVDFGDLITQLLTLFQNRPKILQKYQEQFQYLLVDEFQDTNWAQYELIKLLAAPRNNLTVVGDDDQSIYKFRGASVANILEFKKDFPQSREVVMTENYRTKQSILDLAYAFIQKNNPNRLEVRLAGSAKKSGHALTRPISKKLAAQREGKGTIELLTAQSGEEEVRTVLEKVEKCKMQNAKLSWQDFAILVRANDHAQPFVQACEREGIPYQFVARRGLFQKPVILDCIAYLRLLDNYHESSAMFRVLNWPQFHIANEDLMALHEHARRKAVSLYHAATVARSMPGVSAQSHARIDRLLGFLDRHTQLARDKTASQVLYAVMTDTGYLKAIAGGDAAKSADRLTALNEFFKRILEYEHAGEDPSVRGFVSYLTLALESGDSGEIRSDVEEGPDALRIMTVHGAKGLEFPYVFVVNLVERRFPSSERRDAIEIPDALVREILPEGDVHLQEERRLMYVAATRARDGLFFTRAEDYGGSRRKRPSPFLFELGLLTEEKLSKPKKQAGLVGPLGPRQATGAPGSQTGPRLAPFEKQLVAAHNEFSFTQLIAFEHCPWQYRFAHVLRVPVRPNYTLSFGKTMHQTLFQFFTLLKERQGSAQDSLFRTGDKSSKSSDQKPTVALDELLALYEKNWIDDWYKDSQTKEKYRQKGRETLKTFYQSHQGSFPIPLHLEQSFSVKLGDYSLKGSIDRIDVLTTSPPSPSSIEEGGQGAVPGVEIVDYKTGQYRDKLEGEDRYQLLIYSLAASDRHVLNLRVEKLSFYFLEANRKNSRAPEPKDHEAVTKWAQEIIAKIKSGSFPPTPGMVCGFCDFRDICDYRAV